MQHLILFRQTAQMFLISINKYKNIDIKCTANRSNKSICCRDTSKRAIDQDEFDVEHSIALHLVLDMNKLDRGSADESNAIRSKNPRRRK